MPIIILDKLTKSFNELVAVNEVSFQIEKGEIFGFLGPNGAGKTTTISMLATLLEPTSGDATVNGFDIKTQRDDVRKSIGIVFQDSSLDEELTAYENMDFHGRLYGVPADVRRKKIGELLKLVELQDRKNDFVKTFSGGMRRRLEIARGLLHEPKVLFLDEPTLGLDPQTRDHLWSYIEKLNKEKKITILLTTHYMDEADKLCGRVAIIDHGKIIALDTPAKLKARLGGQSIIIQTEQAAALLKAIGQPVWVKHSKYDRDSVHLSVDDAPKRIVEIVRISDDASIIIKSINIHMPSLEDVFLHFTGRSIREEESSPADSMRLHRRMWRK